MATARPPGGGGNTPTARIGFDYSALRNAPNVAREAGRATARELQQAFKVIQNEQKITLAQAQQAVAAVRAQQTQITSIARSESSQRIAAARAESIERQQAARRETIAFAEEQRRQTAQFRSELRAREQAARTSQVSAGAFQRGALSFTGALVGGIGGPIGALAGGLAGGSLATAAGLAVSQGASAAVAATQTATAYNRQEVAALNLAGSQGRLNSLLEAYTRATGGAVDEATALANVTNLQSIGFGKNAEQLERFVRSARGVSLARGRPMDEMVQEIALTLANQSTRRLDQIGLGIQEVTDRMAQLRAENRNMSREAAFQEAVLSRLEEKYAGLTTSVQGQATGTENFSKSVKNLNLAFGQVLGPTINLVGQVFANYLDIWTARLKLVRMGAEELANVLRQLGVIGAAPVFGIGSRSSIVNRGGGMIQPERIRGGVLIGEEQQALINQRFTSMQRVDRGEINQINETVRDGTRQRASIEANYQKTVIREQQDFARQRTNAERKLQMSILDVAQDSARQRAKWEEDSARTIAKARTDTARRIAELDEDFAKDQARREKDFRDDQLSAAGRLDAIALLELRKDRARELQDRKDAHEEQKRDLTEQLAEREREERDSLQRRIEEQRENDRLRIEEMKQAFEDQKRQEDEERGIRLQRQADDHRDQLDEFDRQQGERIQQIKDQAQEQRDQLDEEFQAELDKMGIRTKAYEKHQEEIEKLATASFDRWWKHVNDEFENRLPGPRTKWPSLANPPSFANGGLVQRSGYAFVHAGEFVMPVPPVAAAASGMSSRSVTLNGDIHVTIAGTTNMGPDELRPMFREEVVNVLVEIGGGNI